MTRRARARRLLLRAARAASSSVWRALVNYGWLWLPRPPEPPAPEVPDGSGPPVGHPERLCPERPLTAVEIQLDRQLGG